jgi:hypothetical protein
MLGILLGDGSGFFDLSVGGVPILAGFEEKSFIFELPSFFAGVLGDPFRLLVEDDAAVGDSLETVIPGVDEVGVFSGAVPDLFRLCDNMVACAATT